MEPSDSFSKSRVIEELRVCFQKQFDLHDEELTAWENQNIPKELPPEWVTNATALMMTPYVRWTESMDDAPPDLESFGKMIGALKFSTDNAKKLATVLDSDKQNGTDNAGVQFLFSLNAQVDNLRQTVQAMLSKVQEYPAYETTDFYKGYHDGLKQNPVDSAGEPIIKNEATKLYCFLILSWRTVEQQKSFEGLHAWLSKFFSRDALGDIERLKGIAKKIGLHLGKRGRPKKEKK